MPRAPLANPPSTRVKSRQSGLRTKAGLTLVEVTVAGCVLVFALCSSFVVLQRGYQVIDTARSGNIAAQIMQSEVERIRLLDWPGVQALRTEDPDLSVAEVFSADTKITERFTTFRRTVTIDSVRNVADIALTVGWTGLDGLTHARVFKARYCKNGLYDFYYTRARS